MMDDINRLNSVREDWQAAVLRWISFLANESNQLFREDVRVAVVEGLVISLL